MNRLTGKIVSFIEPGKDDMPDEIISRMYDPALGRFWQVDPMAEKRYWVNPYNFVQSNPINRVDPTGLTDFAMNRKSGDITQVGDKNDNPDRILKTDKNGNVMKKGDGFLGFLVRESKRGEAKVAIGGIQQGILKDGANFQSKDNVVAVGGQGQATVQGVKDFALKLSNYVGKEVGGYDLASKGGSAINNIYIGRYGNNDAQTERSPFTLPSLNPDLYANSDIKADWHTHLSRFGDNDRLVPSSLNGGGDAGHKAGQLQINPSLRFLIITNPSSTDSRATEIEY